VNETWFNVDHPGIYYGQCSELCGVNHAYMPVEVHAVSQQEFEAWVAAQGGSMATASEAPAAPAAGAAPAAAAPAGTPTR
jgi:cytochrome c oxidase subunit 2